MGVSNGADIMIDQIKYYYIFQKKLELILKGGTNYFFDINKEKNEIEKIYIINSNWIKEWKNSSGYYVAKDAFDKIKIRNETKLLEEMNKVCLKLKKEGIIKKISIPFKNNETAYNNFISKNMMDLEEFQGLVDKKTYDLFKKIDPFNWLSVYNTLKIEGIITDKMVNLLIQKHFSIKIFYYGILENENKLIQLTANCLIIDKGEKLENLSQKCFSELKNYLLEDDSEALIQFFNDKAIGYLKNKNLKISDLPFSLKNENLTLKYLEEEKKTKNINFKNVNIFRKIGLTNVGATCYMNATLQCFINTDALTRYLLKESNYYNILNNINKCELSSAYCELLANVCCDDNVVNYYEPQKFKDIISSKNPLFQGINANDSKDLINFMLEEMNHELSKLNIKNDNVDKNKYMQIDQTNKYLIFNLFKTEFSKNNNSIISNQFFLLVKIKLNAKVAKL